MATNLKDFNPFKEKGFEKTAKYHFKVASLCILFATVALVVLILWALRSGFGSTVAIVNESIYNILFVWSARISVPIVLLAVFGLCIKFYSVHMHTAIVNQQRHDIINFFGPVYEITSPGDKKQTLQAAIMTALLFEQQPTEFNKSKRKKKNGLETNINEIFMKFFDK